MNNNPAAIAEKLYTILNLYSDYLEHGFKQKHEDYDFSSLNQITVTPEVTKPALLASIDKDISTETPQPVIDLKEKKSLLIKVGEEILKCSACPLCNSAKKVPGIGPATAKIMVISNPVTAAEEKAGIPLIGNDGEFFKKWLQAIDINLSNIFITNLVKCSVRNNPLTKEIIEACRQHLDKQIDVIRPSLILSLGQITLSSLRKSFVDLHKHHGQIFYYNGIPFIPTYHPAEVLANLNLKKPVWEDIKKFQIYLKGLSS